MKQPCKECGKEMQVDENGISNHIHNGVIDHDQDADHVAIFGEFEPTYISIYGFKTQQDLDNNNETHIDSITKDGDWENDARSIVEGNKSDYFHITVESDDGKPLPSFNS